MNKQRRKLIAENLARLEQITAAIEAARDDEQEYYDNMPEAIQAAEKGLSAETAVESLFSALDTLQSAVCDLESID